MKVANRVVERTTAISIGNIQHLDNNANYSISWNNGDIINIDKHIDHIVLRYRINSNDINIHVDISQTKVGYGLRSWFNCPVCSQRTAKLYNVLGHFACRTCNNLTYESSRRSRNDLEYIGLKLQRLMFKLDMTGEDYLEPVKFKPKNMHQKTFDLLKMELGIRQIHFIDAWLKQL